MPLANVIGMVHLKEGDKVEFLACAAATQSNTQHGDNVMSGFDWPASEVVTSSTTQRIGAESSNALTMPQTGHKNGTTYMGLMLVKDLEDTSVQKREGGRKSRHGASPAIRMILAKGPDGTKGFLPGWCSRYPLVAAVVEGEEGSKQDVDVFPMGVSPKALLGSKNNTDGCSNNSQGKGNNPVEISTATTVSTST